jgi:hypothetical protein
MVIFYTWFLLFDYQWPRSQVWQTARISRCQYSLVHNIHFVDLFNELEYAACVSAHRKFGLGAI